MDSFFIDGGKKLHGRVRVSGAKNASLPVLFATLICRGVSRIRYLPDIIDVNIALRLIEDTGAKITRVGDVTEIDTRDLRYCEPDGELVRLIRASTYLIGASLSRFGRVSLCSFGGCNFSPRPIDMHLASAEMFGAVYSSHGMICDRLRGTDIVFRRRSVGATVNTLLLASSADGVSRIYGGAREPHILTLVDFLRSAGADIEVGDDCFTVRGGELSGGTVDIPGDMIEAGTFLYAGLITGGEVEVVGGVPEELSVFLEPLAPGGAAYRLSDAGAVLTGGLSSPLDVVCAPYPAYPTDMQPILASLLASYLGGRITDTVFPERFGYLAELASFGVEYERRAGGAIIRRSHLHHGRCYARDLRGGASAVLAALACEGDSEVMCADVVGRGYENFVGKLRSLGAEIICRKNTAEI